MTDTTNALRALVDAAEHALRWINGESVYHPGPSLRQAIDALATAQPEGKPEGVEVGELRVNNAAGENSWKLWDYDLTPQVPPGTHKLYVHLATRQAQGGGEDGR